MLKQLKDGKMKTLFKRNLLSLYLLLALAIVLFVSNMATQYNYIRNYLSDGYELNYESLAEAVGTRDITPQTQTSEQAGLVTAYMDEQVMFYDDYVYYQGKDYRFKITVDEVYDTGLRYDYVNTIYISDAYYEKAEIPVELDYSDKVLIIVSGGRQFLAIADSRDAVLPGDTVTTVFTQLGEYVIQDLGYIINRAGGESVQVLSYYADLRGIPVEYESQDWNFAIGYGIIVLITAFIALIFTVKPYSHPFYRQLLKYSADRDELIAWLDLEFFDETKLEKKDKFYLGEEYMFKKSLFCNVIQKNPYYVPEQQRERESQRYKYKDKYRKYRGNGE